MRSRAASSFPRRSPSSHRAICLYSALYLHPCFSFASSSGDFFPPLARAPPGPHLLLNLLQVLHLDLQELPLPIPSSQLLLELCLHRIEIRLLGPRLLRGYRPEGGLEHLLLDPVVVPDRQAELLGRLGGGQQSHLNLHHQLDSLPVLGRCIPSPGHGAIPPLSLTRRLKSLPR